MRLTNKHGLPQTFVDAVQQLVYDPRDSDPSRVSVTTLISNPRPKILALQHWDEIEEDVVDHIWRIMGSAAHYVLAKVDESANKSANTMVEQKLTQLVDDITVVGKLDLYDGHTRTVQDYKFTSVWSVQFGDHDEWEQQLNPYAWLLRKSGINVQGLQINAIMKDWRRGELLKYNDYPRIPFKVIPVKLWSFEQQESYVRDRVRIYKEAIKTPIDKLPYCAPHERWAKPDVYALYKGTNKTATKLFDTYEAAEDHAQQTFAPNNVQYRIDKRAGEDLKCTQYCNVNRYCKYWQDNYK